VTDTDDSSSLGAAFPDDYTESGSAVEARMAALEARPEAGAADRPIQDRYHAFPPPRRPLLFFFNASNRPCALLAIIDGDGVWSDASVLRVVPGGGADAALFTYTRATVALVDLRNAL